MRGPHGLGDGHRDGPGNHPGRGPGDRGDEQLLPSATPTAKVKRRGNLAETSPGRMSPTAWSSPMPWSPPCSTACCPEQSVRRAWTPPVREHHPPGSRKAGVLVNDATGAETPLPRLTPLVQGQGLALPDRAPLDRRGRQGPQDDPAGRNRHPTPDGSARPVMLGDIDYGWYVGEARQRILANRDFPHLDPKWLSGIAARPPRPRPRPQPALGRQESPKGARKDQPSYFCEWSSYAPSAPTPGPRSASWCWTSTCRTSSASGSRLRSGILGDLDDCMVSYHR